MKLFVGDTVLEGNQQQFPLLRFKDEKKMVCSGGSNCGKKATCQQRQRSFVILRGSTNTLLVHVVLSRSSHHYGQLHLTSLLFRGNKTHEHNLISRISMHYEQSLEQV